MRILNHKQIDELVNWKSLIKTIEQAYQTQLSGCFNMPKRMHVHQSENTLLLMPCFAENRFATKLVSVFPNNTKHHKPAIYGQIVLNDGRTGEVKALISGGKLTAIRTGAVGACAMLKLCPDAQTLGVVGAGVQGEYQAIAAAHVLDIKKVFVFDLNPESVQKFKTEVLTHAPHLEVIQSENIDQMALNSDIIVTATTSSAPVLPNDKRLLKDKTFIAIGSFKPNMQELPDTLFQLIDRYYIDTIHAQHESGDVVQPLVNHLINFNQLTPFANIINSKKKYNGTQLFKSVGMALFDIYIANWLYDKAVQKSIGTEVEF